MNPPTHSPSLVNFSKKAILALGRTALIALLLLPGRIRAFTQPPASPTETSTQSPNSSPARKSSKDTTSLSSLASVTIRLVDPDSLPVARPENLFRHFEVIDERPDTARIGIHSGFTGLRSRNKQLSFGRSAKEEVAAYLNSHFARPGAPYTALVVIRILWLSDANYVREDLMQDRDKRAEKTHIRVKAEIYASKEEGYMPIYRFDSAHISKKSNYSLWGQDLAGMLADFADSASLLTTRKAGKGRTLSREEIQQFNFSRFSAPVTTDTALIRGVYASFDEFRNNNPSIRDFELKKEKDVLLLYVKDPGGTSYYSHNAWGYCDGKDIFIMKDGILRRGWREGRAFYFLSPTDKYVPTYYNAPVPGQPSYSPPLTNTPPKSLINLGDDPQPIYSTVSKAGMRIFTVDMDSGDVF